MRNPAATTWRIAPCTAALAGVLAASAPGPAAAQHDGRCELPGVLVVLDRSASMSTPIGPRTKWDIARDAVVDLVAERGDDIDFGLMLYPGPSGAGGDDWWTCRYNFGESGCSAESPRCTPGEVVLDVGRHDSLAFAAQLGWPEPYFHAYTPTWQSLAEAARHPQLRRPDRRNHVVLITDGWQCCGLFEDGRGGMSCEEMDREEQVRQVRRLRDQGITTYVVGFGTEVDVENLSRMAIEAGTAEADCIAMARPPGPDDICYAQADTEAALLRALEGIGRRIAAEVCDGLDNDCDGVADEALSRACEGRCGPGLEICGGGLWGACDAVAPSPEACDGVDNDCDGRIDEELFRECATACGLGTETCVGGAWQACDAPPAGAEACDGIDNDCDGVVDPDCQCAPGTRRPCGHGAGACNVGTQLCLRRGVWSVACEGGVGPAAEVCDGVDNDCDGVVDGLERACLTACGEGVQVCRAGEWAACDAAAPAVEVCDGLDNDCDGLVDEALVRDCAGDCGAGRQSCDAATGAWGACDVRASAGEDLCGNGVDDDCNGLTDDGCGCAEGAVQPCGIGRGVCVQGTQRCGGGQWGECEGLVVHGQACPAPAGHVCDWGVCAPPTDDADPPDDGPPPVPGGGGPEDAPGDGGASVGGDPSVEVPGGDAGGGLGRLGGGRPEALSTGGEGDDLSGFKPRGGGLVPASACAAAPGLGGRHLVRLGAQLRR